MRKIYFYVTTALLLAMSLPSQAAINMLLTKDQVIFDGYSQTKFWDFESLVDGTALAVGATTLTTGNNVTVYQCTNTDMTNFYFQQIAGNTGFGWRKKSSTYYGLFLYGGDRTMSIDGLHSGQKVVIQAGTTGSTGVGLNIKSDNAVLDSTVSSLYYYTMTADGHLDFLVTKLNYIPCMAIYTAEASAEYVTTPEIKLTGVNGTSRKVTITAGTSSKGNECKTYYSFNGADPLYRDANGKPEAYNGEYGDYPYAGEFDTDGADSVETGNVVTVKAITLSSTGVQSDVATTKISVGEITLNSPTLTLVNIDGKTRAYKIGWTNNTLCGEEYVLSYVTGDGGSGTVSIGDNVASTKGPIVITATAVGYLDGVTTLDKVEQEGSTYYKKTGDAATHDWDFVNLSTEMLSKLKGSYQVGSHQEVQTVDSIVTDPNTGAIKDTIKVQKTVDVADYGYYNWYFNSSKNRCNLDIIPDTVIAQKKDAEGNLLYDANGIALMDTTVTCTYAKDSCNLLAGLTISGADPYVNSSKVWSSDIFIYTNGGGLWITANKPTIHVPGTQLGDIVVYNVAGTFGSTVASGDTTAVTLPFSYPYLYYVDIYRTDGQVDGITSASTVPQDVLVRVYTVDGRLLRNNVAPQAATRGLQKGLYIVGGRKVAVK
jgi:hypothetical protein